MEVFLKSGRLHQSAALARYSNANNQNKITQQQQTEPLKQIPSQPIPAIDQPAVAFHKAERYEPKIEDESYQNLIQQARTKKESRRRTVHSLALRYSKSLGHDVEDGKSGQAWFEKTVDFYSSSDDMMKRLQDLVETSEKIPA